MTIVVGYSGKAEGLAALKAAVIEAGARNTRLIVVPTTADDDLDAARAELAGLEHTFAPAPSETMTVGDRVLEEAQESSASMIVIGLRRRSPSGKLILGANAQKVLLDAPCPVLAVKAGDPIG